MRSLEHFWIVAVMALLITACPGVPSRPPAPQPSAFDLLSQAEATITTGIETLRTAVTLGTVDIASMEYAHVYAGLEDANQLMDTAWDSYRAGNLEQANALRRLSMDAYMAIRPMLYDLAGQPQ